MIKTVKMMKFREINKIVILLIINLSIIEQCFSQVSDYSSSKCKLTESKKGMELVWSDEFNDEGVPDSSKWIFENGFVRNRELQWYQSDNTYCSGGLLIIEGRREKKINPDYDSLSSNWRYSRPYANYTSSSLKTQGLHSWLFGRFEIRARIDTSCGLWPAIWTLGVNGQWPENGEIDLMEFYRIKNHPYILANVAWGTQKKWQAKWDKAKVLLTDIMGEDQEWSQKFHIWSMEWTQDSINIYIDDKLLNSCLLNNTINQNGSNPFHQPHYIIINLAIGENGGNPSKTMFPVKYEIDYVRVYQKKCN